MTTQPHAAVEDGDTGYCAACPLPMTHPSHLVDVEARTLAPVDTPVARVGLNAPATSQRAVAAALPRSGTVKSMIFRTIANRAQGATDDEIEVILDRTHQSVSAARNALAADGWIEPLTAAGAHVTRRTRSGNDAYVWVASAAARAQMPASALGGVA